MWPETILTNALLVLPGEAIAGTVALRGARIAEVQPGRSHLPGAEEAAWRCVAECGTPLPAAVAMVTDRPARMAGLDDRGRIEAGLRADLAQLRPHAGLPVVRRVWRAGERVA